MILPEPSVWYIIHQKETAKSQKWKSSHGSGPLSLSEFLSPSISISGFFGRAPHPHHTSIPRSDIPGVWLCHFWLFSVGSAVLLVEFKISDLTSQKSGAAATTANLTCWSKDFGANPKTKILSFLNWNQTGRVEKRQGVINRLLTNSFGPFC